MTAPPFSDSTSGELFTANRCAVCVHRGIEGEPDGPCDDFTPALLGEWPTILFRDPANPVGVECRKFETEEKRAVTAPVPLALRELMILTKCYCDGEHPRLEHNCSFRPDVETVVAAVGEALRLADPINTPHAPDPWVIAHLDAIRRALLGLPADEGPPWGNGPGGGVPEEPIEHAYAAEIAQKLQRGNGNTAPRVSEVGGSPPTPG